jgi:DNA/RNA endonuclease YhcR with UshA esterase domain
MKNLVVTDTYTTKDGPSKGAITITCKTEDNKTITVRTSVLTDENDEIVKETVFEGKTIDVTGIVDYYNNAYQVAVHIYSNIDIH